jgi:hypothetical protein
MDDESIMPLVLEEGDIVIRIDNAVQSVGGTPLNDSLFVFIDKHNQLTNRMSELGHRQSQMLLDGIDEDQINRQLSAEADLITAEEDRLVTKFICDNFDNVLGPGIFMMITSGYRYPILTPQIEDIMSKATDKFKNDPYVKDYYQVATENQARQTGLRDVQPATVPQAEDQMQPVEQPGSETMPQPQQQLQPQEPLTNVPQTDENPD